MEEPKIEVDITETSSNQQSPDPVIKVLSPQIRFLRYSEFIAGILAFFVSLIFIQRYFTWDFLKPFYQTAVDFSFPSRGQRDAHKYINFYTT